MSPCLARVISMGPCLVSDIDTYFYTYVYVCTHINIHMRYMRIPDEPFECS